MARAQNVNPPFFFRQGYMPTIHVFLRILMNVTRGNKPNSIQFNSTY